VNPTKALGFLLKGGMPQKKGIYLTEEQFCAIPSNSIESSDDVITISHIGAQDLHVNLEMQNSWVKNELN